VLMENCLLAGTAEVSIGSNETRPRWISISHDQTSGKRREWQRYGTSDSTADGDFADDTCDEIDPSSATYPFRYRIQFPCKSGKTPTLTFEHKRTGAPGVCTVSLGMQACGLTGIATGGTITLSDTVATHTVTFTGTTTMGGMVEVIIDVLDGDGSDTLRLGHPVASDNL
jgi:hypothetical protein